MHILDELQPSHVATSHVALSLGAMEPGADGIVEVVGFQGACDGATAFGAFLTKPLCLNSAMAA